VKPGFRNAMTWLHDWAGLIVGWLLFVIALAGTLSVFRSEIGNWMRPEARCCAAASVTAGSAAVHWLGKHAATSPAWYIQPADRRSATSYAVWTAPGGDFAQKWLDPKTGDPATVRDTLGGDFFYRLHFELELPFPWGRVLAGAAAVAMLLALITGIVAHRRFFVDFFTFRAGKGQRSWLDAHNVLAVTALPFHLMIAFTGALTLANLIMPWGASSLYRGDMAAVWKDLYPAAVDRPARHVPAPLAPIAPMLGKAKRFFGSDIAQIAILNPGDAAAVVSVTSGEDQRIGIQRQVISFDGTTGRPIAAHVERRPALRTFNFLYALHTARFGETLTRWLYFVCGLMLTALIGAGLVLWTEKRRAQRQGLGFAIVERLNIAIVAGTPLAFAAFFLANRLLPIDLAQRAATEVRVMFWLWGAILIYAALRPARRAWREILTVTAAACAAIPLTDLITRSMRLDRLHLTVALIALALAAGFVFAARRAGGRRATA